MLKAELNSDKTLVANIKAALKANDGYCPCTLEHLKENKCMCEDFKHNIPVGELCHCGLYKKIGE